MEDGLTTTFQRLQMEVTELRRQVEELQKRMRVQDAEFSAKIRRIIAAISDDDK